MPEKAREGSDLTGAPAAADGGHQPPASTPGADAPHPALTCRAHLLFALVAVIGLAADLGSKTFMFRWLGWPSERLNPVPPAGCEAEGPLPHPHFTIIPCLFRFHTSINSGGIWGKFDGNGTFLAAFSVIAAFVVLYWHSVTPASQWIRRIALGLLLAGAMGNFYDRIFVRPDFVEFRYGGRDVGLLDDRTTIAVEGAHIPLGDIATMEIADDGTARVVKTDGTTVTGRCGDDRLLLYADYDRPDAGGKLHIPLRPGNHNFDVVRIRRHLGAVRDFLAVHYKNLWYYPIFNLADSWLCIGVGILLLASLRDSREDFAALGRGVSRLFGSKAAPGGK